MFKDITQVQRVQLFCAITGLVLKLLGLSFTVYSYIKPTKPSSIKDSMETLERVETAPNSCCGHFCHFEEEQNE